MKINLNYFRNSPYSLRAKDEDNEWEPFGKLGTHRPQTHIFIDLFA
ncbi:MAG: hypothetical protein KDK54_12295 [Leptospiraceae bacterium]|nr:hypothetical protein [Leptospiraceae bacterium]